MEIGELFDLLHIQDYVNAIKKLCNDDYTKITKFCNSIKFVDFKKEILECNNEMINHAEIDNKFIHILLKHFLFI